MSVHYSNYPSGDAQNYEFHMLSTSVAAISVYAAPTGDSVSVHLAHAIQYVHPLQFDYEGNPCLAFNFRTVDGRMVDITVPEFDVATLIVRLQAIAAQQQVTE
jgi:hypothetical protein